MRHFILLSVLLMVGCIKPPTPKVDLETVLTRLDKLRDAQTKYDDRALQAKIDELMVRMEALKPKPEAEIKPQPTEKVKSPLTLEQQRETYTGMILWVKADCFPCHELLNSLRRLAEPAGWTIGRDSAAHVWVQELPRTDPTIVPFIEYYQDGKVVGTHRGFDGLDSTVYSILNRHPKTKKFTSGLTPKTQQQETVVYRSVPNYRYYSAAPAYYTLPAWNANANTERRAWALTVFGIPTIGGMRTRCANCR